MKTAATYMVLCKTNTQVASERAFPLPTPLPDTFDPAGGGILTYTINPGDTDTHEYEFQIKKSNLPDSTYKTVGLYGPTDTNLARTFQCFFDTSDLVPGEQYVFRMKERQGSGAVQIYDMVFWFHEAVLEEIPDLRRTVGEYLDKYVHTEIFVDPLANPDINRDEEFQIKLTIQNRGDLGLINVRQHLRIVDDVYASLIVPPRAWFKTTDAQGNELEEGRQVAEMVCDAIDDGYELPPQKQYYMCFKGKAKLATGHHTCRAAANVWADIDTGTLLTDGRQKLQQKGFYIKN